MATISTQRVVTLTEGEIERVLESILDLDRNQFKIKSMIPVADGTQFSLTISIEELNHVTKQS